MHSVCKSFIKNTVFPSIYNLSLLCMRANFADDIGDMVRCGPNEMSFCTIEAFRDIYCHYSAGKNKLLKTQAMDSEAYPRVTSVKDPVVHAEQRRALSHAFSAKALRFQEDLVHKYVNLWISQLNKLGENGTKAVNITDAFDWITFDIIGTALGALCQN